MFSRNLLFLTFLPFWPFDVQHRGLLALAEVGRVDQEALLAAFHVEDELLHRHVRHVVEHGLQPAVLGADHAAQLDVHLAAQVGDQVRQLVVGGDQVDRALQLACSSSGVLRFGVAVDRACRAGLRGQLRPRADRLDVALVEEQRVRQRQRRAAEVGVAFAGFEDRPQLRVLRPLGRPPNSRACSFGLKPSLLQPVAWNGALTGVGAERRRVGRVGAAAVDRRRWSPAAAQLVGLSMNLLRSTLTSIERMSSLTPPNTSGIGSETALTWAVSGLTLSATRTTTVPRSNGPATAGRDHRQRERGALVGAGEVGLAAELERARAGAGVGRGRCRSGSRSGSSELACSALPLLAAAAASAASEQ